MSRLVYFTLSSVDGYIGGENDYTWSPPDEEVLNFINELMRPIGTYLYGRKTYETMAVWETPDLIPSKTPAMLGFAEVWQAADKIVYSTTLREVSTSKTRLEQAFEPAAVRDLKAQASRDITIGGPHLAAQAMQHDLVDDYRVLVVPALRGGGVRVFTGDRFLHLNLTEERRFAKGWVYLRYQPR